MDLSKYTEIYDYDLRQKLKNSNLKIKNPYEYVFPNNLCCTYMVGQITCNVIFPQEQMCAIKVGMSEDFKKRINQYKGTNINIKCIDISRHYYRDKAEKEEKEWHNKLEKYYERIGRSEWFIVPYSHFLKFLELGFDIKLEKLNPEKAAFYKKQKDSVLLSKRSQ